MSNPQSNIKLHFRRNSDFSFSYVTHAQHRHMSVDTVTSLKWILKICKRVHNKRQSAYGRTDGQSDAQNMWWSHQMETFSALLAICKGNSPVAGEFPAQRPVTRSFDIFFDLQLNKWLSKQSWGWWIETPSHPLWRHCNEKRSNQHNPFDDVKLG